MTRATLVLALLALVVTWVTPACEESPADERIDAPESAAEQLQALEADVDAAESAGDHVRAEVALEALLALDPDNDATLRRARLRRIRRGRRIADAMAEVADLIEHQALRTASAAITALAELELNEVETARLADLRLLHQEASLEAADRRLIDRATEGVLTPEGED